jgi:hypothetical protein
MYRPLPAVVGIQAAEYKEKQLSLNVAGFHHSGHTSGTDLSEPGAGKISLRVESCVHLSQRFSDGARNVAGLAFRATLKLSALRVDGWKFGQ